VVWNKTGADKDIGVPEFWLIPDRESFEKYEFPPIDEQYIKNICEWLMETPETQFRGFCIGFSLFERLWTMMGMENALMNMMLEPDLIHDVLNKICDRNITLLDMALAYDVDFVYFGDDWGQQHGLIMGTPHWHSFIKPYLGKMYARVRDKGKFVAQHSCGDIRSIMDDLYELGLNMYQTFQPEIYGLDYAEKIRNKITIWGGISTQRDLPYKTPDEIKQITRETLDAFKDHGGLVAAPTHSIPDDVPPENIVAMLDVLMNQ
jgi:uroporphyrinogen decarboxylase